MRAELERIDDAFVALMVERLALARRIGEAKRSDGRPVLDPAREAAVVRRVGERARQAGLPDEEVREIFWRIIALCRGAQRDDVSAGLP